MLQSRIAPVFQLTFIRFLLSGFINTVGTFGIYLGLLYIFPYQFSYGLAYCSGIAISYFLNRIFVFRNHRGIVSVLMLPLAYVFQYMVAAFLLWFLVEKMGCNTKLAPLFVLGFTVPAMYFFSRVIFLRKNI